ncbi:flagellin [Sulfurirhabdus autotrophica]|uniref:Flagellin n=1 Tax=Sulfurirhabdus autotrophica TaxID=1706046 RepID=A0A4R3YG32_9PROT|nr:flagellin [Sulfurirhabdus autotrophica]TCV90168.1 flagellin [Sulfurirhabdus autotrophica]
MAQVINTNVASLFAGAALNKSNLALQTAQQRLSSGLRINSAKDDATGLVTATGYDSQIRGANQAIRNANDGISTAQTNDGYHAQVLENLQRLREIAVQLGGTAAGAETTALAAENTRILGLAANTGTVVVNSNGGTVTGVGTKATVAGTLTVAGIDADITAVTTARATYGADMATFSSAVANLQVQSVNLSASYSRIMDTDYAMETQNMTRNNILQQAGTAMLAQANQTPNTVLSLLR